MDSYLTRRFFGVYENRLHTVSTGLDPRFKLHLFTSAEQAEARADIMTATLQCQPMLTTAPVQPFEAVHEVDELLRRKTFGSSVDQLQLVQAHNNDMTVKLEREMNTCLAETCVPKDTDPVDWWKMNMSRFPILCHTARRYLPAPPTSVPSKRLFSTASDTFSKTRSCLNADNMERLVFSESQRNIHA